MFSLLFISHFHLIFRFILFSSPSIVCTGFFLVVNLKSKGVSFIYNYCNALQILIHTNTWSAWQFIAIYQNQPMKIGSIELDPKIFRPRSGSMCKHDALIIAFTYTSIHAYTTLPKTQTGPRKGPNPITLFDLGMRLILDSDPDPKY